MQLEIVSHCWNYSRLLTYQLSSLVLHPPKDCTVKATIFHSVEDAETVQTLEWFAGRQVERVEWNFLSLPPKQLMRRAIGRNIAALASKADAVLFSDCDYAFGDGALDQIAVTLQQQFVTGDKICWPEWVMQSKLHKHGDAEVQRVESPGLYEVDAQPIQADADPGCNWWLPVGAGRVLPCSGLHPGVEDVSEASETLEENGMRSSVSKYDWLAADAGSHQQHLSDPPLGTGLADGGAQAVRDLKHNCVVGVVACGRDICTLSRTITGIRNAGAFDPIVRIDHPKSGAWKNWLLTLEMVLSDPLTNHLNPQFILMMEDDAVLSFDVFSYLETLDLSKNEIYSLYCANGSSANKTLRDWNFGFYTVEAPRYSWGALAYLMHIDLARKILATPPFPDRKDGTDHAIGTFCKTNNVSYLVHFPSLVKHIGAISSLEEVGGVDEFRQAKYWGSDCHQGRIAVVEELRPPIVFRNGTSGAGGSLDRDSQNAVG